MFMRSFRPITGCACLLLGALAAGCEQIDNPGKLTPGSPGVDGTRSVELQRSQLDDVPVPRDMALITRANRSFSYTSAGVRVGRFRFRGDVPVDEILSFYRSNMPVSAYGWTPNSENAEGGVTTLSYTKGSDRCDIQAKREEGATTLLVMVNCEPLKDQ